MACGEGTVRRGGDPAERRGGHAPDLGSGRSSPTVERPAWTECGASRAGRARGAGTAAGGGSAGGGGSGRGRSGSGGGRFGVGGGGDLSQAIWRRVTRGGAAGSLAGVGGGRKRLLNCRWSGVMIDGRPKRGSGRFRRDGAAGSPGGSRRGTVGGARVSSDGRSRARRVTEEAGTGPGTQVFGVTFTTRITGSPPRHKAIGPGGGSAQRVAAKSPLPMAGGLISALPNPVGRETSRRITADAMLCVEAVEDRPAPVCGIAASGYRQSSCRPDGR